MLDIKHHGTKYPHQYEPDSESLKRLDDTLTPEQTMLIEFFTLEKSDYSACQQEQFEPLVN